MQTSYSVKEEYIPFSVNDETFQTYCKIITPDHSNSNENLVHNLSDGRDNSNGTVIVLHGGPGCSHDYLLPLADLSLPPYNLTVILYDQLGTGLSTHLPSKHISFWSIDLFISELENLLSHFHLHDGMSEASSNSNSYNIIGHSWGAILAAEFIVRRRQLRPPAPTGLRKLVLTNCLASASLRNAAIRSLRQKLPKDVLKTLQFHEEAGTTKSVEYRAAMDIFWQCHACRLDPWPEEVTRSIKYWPERDPTVLDSMRNGPENLSTGWDITSRIHLMAHIPLLLISGEYDFMTNPVCEPFFWGADKAKWVKFANSSHTPFWEERERFMEVVGRWFVM
ncbi:hypothetical protein D9758_011529 [Tetrapyrgos nigripes]|uniref:AB hydrolase-1 domain-containing protein n=1 Tax=Tetrapyrgos nigripes TaxID=182062 RepID=A0A8H5CQT0_9AGAR|nr:hypothetical protein D9758_011529 [Tetrapyrgos nigripes]